MAGYFQVLRDSLAERLAGGAIGTPVSLRLFLQLSEDHGLLVPHASLGLELAERWLGGEAEIAHIQGSVQHGYLSAMAKVGVATALIHAELIRPADSGANVRVLLIANQGSVEFEDSPADVGETTANTTKIDRALEAR